MDGNWEHMLTDDDFEEEDTFNLPQGIVHGTSDRLRRITTARSIRAMNAAVRMGFFPLVKPVIPDPEITNCARVHQDPDTGFVELQGDLRRKPRSKAVTDFIPYYPYRFIHPYAAYLLPRDLMIGEIVWLEDIIQDIVAWRGPQFFVGRLGACAAVWNGVDFDVQFNPKTNIHRVVG
jgi:hypothetical protein